VHDARDRAASDRHGSNIHATHDRHAKRPF
jgi:hypothetical protein